MTTRLGTAVRGAMISQIPTALDAGPGLGYVELRTGAQPATVGTAATGTLLATMTLAKPSFGAAANGSVAVNAVAEDTAADASGTAGWFRAYASDGTAVIDGAIPADMTISPSAAVVAGGVVDIGSWTLTQPAG